MSDESNVNGSTVPATSEPISEAPAESVADAKTTETPADATNGAAETADMEVDDAKAKTDDKETTENEPKEPSSTEDKSTEDTEMKEAEDKANGDATATDTLAAVQDDSAAKEKSRRKSGGIPEHKTKKLNRKQSKAKMTHTDAKPGDYFYVQMKGHPSWPAVICDEAMLPQALLNSRPVSAMRSDGTWREDYAEGGKNINGRTFPVMYMYTNEFSWTVNTALLDLDLDTIGDTSEGKRKDLYQACMIAAEKHDLEYFKNLLQEFVENAEAEKAEREAAEEAKKAKKANKNKRKSQATVGEDTEDVEMVDAPEDVAEEGSDEKPAKKRKTSTEETPKPKKSIKVKLNATPKAANGTATPKSTKKEKAESAAKPKTKKGTTKSKGEGEASTPAKVEDTRTPEELHKAKEKEVMFLRHKLQKGLLAKEAPPKESEMKAMSEFVTKLESYADLEVSIIRSTKINKVLKAILKLPAIPLEEEYHFKDRSSNLLNKWNQILDGVPESAAANGHGEEKKVSPAEDANASVEVKAEEPVQEEKEEEKKVEKAPEEVVDESEKVPESKEIVDDNAKTEDDAAPTESAVEEKEVAAEAPTDA